MSLEGRTDIARQLTVAALLLLIVAVLGAGGYHVLGEGRWSWTDCLYMTMITLSTPWSSGAMT